MHTMQTYTYINSHLYDNKERESGEKGGERERERVRKNERK